MPSNYWSKVLDNRISRRRGLTVAGAGVMSAAFLAACGGSDSGNSANDAPDKASLVTKPEDTAKQAKKGGILKERLLGDAPTMDVQQPISPLNRTARHVYNTLVRPKRNYLDETNFDVEPDLAESWEVSPDGLTINMKLRANAKWHNKAPVNGRAVDASDVIFSWNRYSQSAPLRALVANSSNPQAPVLSMTATDPRTVSIKLKEPVVYLLQLLASYGSFTGNVVIIPKEVESGFDIRRDMIGTGPFYLDNYTPSVSYTLKRNDAYWDANANLVDQINYPIVTEYAAVLSQLKAGNIHLFDPAGGLRGEDIFQLKKDDPRLQIYAVDLETKSTVMTFGQLPASGNAFADERVRQAYSMSWDRNTWIDAFFNVPALESGGLPVNAKWNSALPADFGDAWLDPQGKDFGENAKYYQYNVAEAKKLLAAAGHANGVNVKSNRITTNLIANLSRYAEALEGMAAEAGFKTTINAIDYNTEYIPQVRDANGQYEGVGFHTVTGTTPWRIHPASALASEYWSKAGATFKGFSTSGKNDKAGDPAVDSIIEKLRLEKDASKRKSMMGDLQKDLAKKMYGLINPGSATEFAVAWPALRNYQVYRVVGNSPWGAYSQWIDDTKAPNGNS
jgi:peptide/nickel transport system substrate-binding protein